MTQPRNHNHSSKTFVPLLSNATQKGGYGGGKSWEMRRERNHSEVPSNEGGGGGSPTAWPQCQLLPWSATVLSNAVQLEVCRRGEGPTTQNVHLIKVENML